MQAKTIGIVLAKHVFQLHGVDQHCKTVLTRKLKRDQMHSFFVNLPSCLIGMEACASAHFWAKKLQGVGHTVKLMAPQFVKPYVKTNKNDAADAEAICEALIRPTMLFVPIKSSEQLAVLALHRARQGFVKARTAQANQIRGLLAEYGHIIPQGISHIRKQVTAFLEDEHLKDLDKQVRELEDTIVIWHQACALSQKLAQLPGIGLVTTCALVASIGDAKNFKNGRQLAAWQGLVPRQHSSGSKQTLLGISKSGDSYLRTLLIHGARSVFRVAKYKASFAESWLGKVRTSP